MSLPERLSSKLRELPDKPGCYIMRDRFGRIIYVGKAASLRKRVQSYFRRATLRSASPKLRGLIKSVDDLDLVVTRSEAEALLTEGRLIKDFKPRYNVSFRDDKRFLLLRGDAAEPFPRLKLCRFDRNDGARYFGPYASSRAARATLDFVEKRFGLRKCGPRIPDDTTYRHCLDEIIRHCSAPCVGKVTPEGYRDRFEQACAFLRGERPEQLRAVEAAMNEAAQRLDFELATALRDTLFALRATIQQRARAAATPARRRADAKAGVAELQSALGLATAPRAIEAYDISNISGTNAVAGMICFVDGSPQRNRYRRFRIRTVEGSDDPAMMAEVIRRRFTRLRDEGGQRPDLVLVDGGMTQVGAAREVLRELDMASVPAAGLAKRYEDLYWEERRPPLRLPRTSPALKLLQQMRDEAHRFALAYHHSLRSRRIRESVLDEIDGIGPVRRKALLDRFGSVRRLAQAGETEVANVGGIGIETARSILARLRGHEADADPKAKPS
jgi:excinuclease ABC subunit C